MERRRNKQALYKSNFIFPEDFHTLPPIKLKINECSKEIDDDLITLKDEKIFSNRIKKNRLSIKIFQHYKKKDSIIKKNIVQSNQKTKSTFEKTNKSFSLKEDPYKSKIKKKLKFKTIENDKEDLEPIKINFNLTSLGESKIDKKKIMKDLNEIDEVSLLTNKILIKRNGDHDKKIFRKMRRKIRSNKKKLFIADEEYLKPEKIRPFDIPTKKNMFYSNLDKIIHKIKESSLSSGVIVEKMKNLNLKGHDYYKRQKDVEIQEKGFQKFDDIIKNGDLLKKIYDKNYEKIQQKLKEYEE
jgi:hypothetical protein